MAWLGRSKPSLEQAERISAAHVKYEPRVHIVTGKDDFSYHEQVTKISKGGM
jgi:hypothetical protein